MVATHKTYGRKPKHKAQTLTLLSLLHPTQESTGGKFRSSSLKHVILIVGFCKSSKLLNGAKEQTSTPPEPAVGGTPTLRRADTAALKADSTR